MKINFKILVGITLMLTIILLKIGYVKATDVKGDINEDGVWSYEDVLLLNKYVYPLGKVITNDEKEKVEKNGDINGDGLINYYDLVLLADMDYPERPKDGVPDPDQTEEDNESGTTDSSQDSGEFTPTGTSADDWLKTCYDLAKKIDGNFRYDGGAGTGTYAAAAKGNKKTNCALYVSWCLQEYGVLKKNQKFYSSGYDLVSKTGAITMIKKTGATVKKVNRQVKNYYKNLQPGDICCYKDHVNVYVGEGEGDYLIWHDAGFKSTTDGKKGSIFKQIENKKRKGSYSKTNGTKLITYVIRLNYK